MSIKSIAFEVFGWAVIAVIVALLGTGLVGLGSSIVNYFTQSVTLMPCPTEDSDNCYWDAQEQGNGQGRSFVVLDGTVHYAE